MALILHASSRADGQKKELRALLDNCRWLGKIRLLLTESFANLHMANASAFCGDTADIDRTGTLPEINEADSHTTWLGGRANLFVVTGTYS
jgi:hypothetical protein